MKNGKSHQNPVISSLFTEKIKGMLINGYYNKDILGLNYEGYLIDCYQDKILKKIFLPKKDINNQWNQQLFKYDNDFYYVKNIQFNYYYMIIELDTIS